MKCRNSLTLLIVVCAIVLGLPIAFAEEEPPKAISTEEDEYLFHELPIGKGKLHVISRTKGAKILLNGETTAYETPATVPDLIPGRYEIKATRKRRCSAEKTVWVREGRTTEVELKLPSRTLYGCLVSIGAVIAVTTAIMTVLLTG